MSPEGGGDIQATVFLRPLGNPMPLGFFALAAGTFALATLQLGWIPVDSSRDIGLGLIVLVAPLQLVSSVLCFAARDATAGAAMGLQGGTWLLIGLVTLSSSPGATSDALGVFLLAVAADLAVPALAAARTKLAVAVVVGGTAARFAVTALYELSGATGWERAAGAVGLALFVAAVYAGAAADLADARGGRGPLPLGRGPGGAPVESSPTESIAAEAGVRPRL